MSPTEIDLSSIAMFLDLDGTLADIVERPSLVHVPDRTKAALRALHDKLDGALAIVSGRCLSDIDMLLTPHTFACAACHGAVIRTTFGLNENGRLSEDTLGRLSRLAKEALLEYDGVLIEAKKASLAIHYRMAPQHGARCRAFAKRLVDLHSGLDLISGKMVVEVVPKGTSKGRAIESLLKVPPFSGRRPLFLGDDLSDESAFGVVNACSGLSIKVGLGPTQASHRLHSPDDVRNFISRLAASKPRGLRYKSN